MLARALAHFDAVLGALAWLVMPCAHAQAEPARVALTWQTPDASGCASQREIEAEVGRLTEREPSTRGQSYQIQALALLHEGRWVASVALLDEHERILGGREVTGEFATCRDLDVPVALVVATLLDGLRAPAEPAPEPPASAPTDEPKKPAHKLGVGAFVAGAWGLAPALAAGAGLDVQLPLGWPLVFEASAYLPREQVDGAGRGVRSFSFHAGAGVCPRLFGQRHQLRLCGGLQLGGALATSVGLTDGGRAIKPLMMVGLEPKLVLGLTKSWAMQLSLGLHVAALRPRFEWNIEGSGERSLTVQPFALVARIGIIDFLR